MREAGHQDWKRERLSSSDRIFPRYWQLISACPLLYLILATLPVALGLTGCTTHSKRIAGVHSAFHGGDLQVAESEAAKLLKKSKRDADLVKLDQSMIMLANGEAQKSEEALREVRDTLEQTKPDDLIGDISAWVLDEQSRSYRPDDYERLFLFTYLAMSNLLQDGDDAFAYVNQLQTVEKEISAKLVDYTKMEGKGHKGPGPDPDELPPTPIPKTTGVAIAPFIAGILFEQTHRDYDSAERQFAKAVAINPENPVLVEALRRSQHGVHSAPGNGVLYVFAGLGRGPRKIETAEIATSQAMLIADRILTHVGDHTLPPTLAPVKIADVVVPENAIRSLTVTVDGTPIGRTTTLTNLGQIAVEQHRAKRNMILARAVVRRIVKKSAIYVGKDAMGTSANGWVDLALNVGGVLWEAAESADTRSWGLLPEKIDVLRIELPAGDYQIGLVPNLNPQKSAGVSLPESTTSKVTILNGKNTYMMGHFPAEKVTGKVLVSKH